jgi:hypothetical protein
MGRPRAEVRPIVRRDIRGWRAEIGTIADITGLVAISVAVSAAVVGFVISEPLAGLVLGLALSLFLNVALSVAYARNRSKAQAYVIAEDATRGSLATLEAAVESLAEAAKPAQARTNPWIGQPGNLSTLRVSTSALEAAYEAAISVARARLGDDAEVRFFSLRLATFLGDSFEPDEPQVLLEAYSAAAERDALIVYSPIRQAAYVNNVTRKKDPTFLSIEAAPWRSDPSWERLAHLSWLRMRPFKGDVVMYYTRYLNRWSIDYDRLLEGESLPTVRFGLDEAQALVELP